MPDTLEAFASDCRRLSQRLGGEALERVTSAAALEAKKASLDVARSVLGGDLAARNFAKGRRFGVGYDLTGPGKATINYRPPGGWVLFDTGARRHLIGHGRRRTARGRTTGRKGQRQLLAIGGDVVTGPVRHPGMRGKRMFTRAVAEVVKVVPDAVAKAYVIEITKGLTHG